MHPQQKFDRYTLTRNGEVGIATDGRYGYNVTALPVTMGGGMVRRLAREIADSLIADARTVHGPVVWVTGNSYVPPMRSITAAEAVWQAANNGDGELWAWLVELVESHLDDANVLLDCPEYDNALYVVDLARWQYVEDAAGDDLNDEWEPVTAD